MPKSLEQKSTVEGCRDIHCRGCSSNMGRLVLFSGIPLGSLSRKYTRHMYSLREVGI